MKSRGCRKFFAAGWKNMCPQPTLRGRHGLVNIVSMWMNGSSSRVLIFSNISGQLPQWLPAKKPVKRVVDVCTGSGCLAILLAHQFPEAKVDAIELSPDAMAVAKFNVATHAMGKRVKLFHSDVFDAVPRAKYDIISANPGHVPTRELRDLPAEFKNEPQMALDGGQDGLVIIRKLLCQSTTDLSRTVSSCWKRGRVCVARWTRAFPELGAFALAAHGRWRGLCLPDPGGKIERLEGLVHFHAGKTAD